MSASCDMEITFTGNRENFEKLIRKLMEIEGKPVSKFTNNPYHPFQVDLEKQKINAYNFLCGNIWGNYYLDPEADLYLELAKVVPEDEFYVKSYRVYEVGGGNCETSLEVFYKNKTLTFKSQPMVDYVSLADLCSDLNKDDVPDEMNVVIVGGVKIHEDRDELIEYLEVFDYNVVPSNEFDESVNVVICNNKNRKSAVLEKAKEFNIPIYTEAEFILRFCEIWDFEDCLEEIVKSLSFEELCENYKIDETITEEEFEKLKKDPSCGEFVLYGDRCISFDGPWNIETYILEGDEFVKTK